MAQVAEPQADSEELLSGESGDMPSAEQLLSILDELKGLSEEEREDLRQSLLSAKLPPVMLEQEASPMTSQSMVLVSMLGILTLIFVFFGYKLYKSLTDKERKRDEKRKMKQQKKKK